MEFKEPTNKTPESEFAKKNTEVLPTKETEKTIRNNDGNDAENIIQKDVEKITAIRENIAKINNSPELNEKKPDPKEDEKDVYPSNAIQRFTLKMEKFNRWLNHSIKEALMHIIGMK